ncbi:hypothetical protein B0H11DRAFT_2018178 [Mycena galericulata]|nr:hypothetical protein B0H11DRAFT_2018178 [Mycena galericulata]
MSSMKEVAYMVQLTALGLALFELLELGGELSRLKRLPELDPEELSELGLQAEENKVWNPGDSVNILEIRY